MMEHHNELSDDLKVILEKAEEAMMNSNWTVAASEYDRILSERPDISHFWICKGLALSFLGRTDETWDCLCRAIEAEPNNEEPWQVRLEFSVDEEGDYLRKHLEAYFGKFGNGPEQALVLADKIFTLSNSRNMRYQIALGLCDRVLATEPKNKRARKLSKQIQKTMKKL